jgi:hypothetical protein
MIWDMGGDQLRGGGGGGGDGVWLCGVQGFGVVCKKFKFFF